MERWIPRRKLVLAARRRLDHARDESGQTLLLITIAMVVFLGIGALVLDVAELGVAHHRAQLAADAAALSAAQDMSTTTTPTSIIDNDGTAAATANDPSSTVTISQPTDLQAKAQVSAPVSLPFGSMFGFGTGGVSAQAVAQVNTSVTNVDGTILSAGCGNGSTTNCTYCADGPIPTGETQADDGWQVTDTAEDPTTGYTPQTDPNIGSNCDSPTAGETSVNLQTCQGSQGSGYCYDPGATTPEATYAEVVDLNGQTEGGMWQTVTTTPGARYVLNFWLTGNPGLDGWPGPTNNSFPLDVYVTDGSSTPYTPSYNEASTPASPCASHRPAHGYITCGWWDYQDDVCGANTGGLTLTGCTDWEQADFTQESLTFIAESTSTTITFNSETNDDDDWNSSQNKGWYFCGPEVANISLGLPEIQLVQ
jgi:Flp pilus assembly protein TadG